MSPYINDRDKIIIPEATRVNNQHTYLLLLLSNPRKYSLTIAGRKIQLRLLVLGVIVILGASIPLAVTLTKKGGDLTHAPNIAPSVLIFPMLSPSVSNSPTSTLQDELVDVISNYSGGNI